MKLYESPASGNAHKIRLFLSFLGKDYEPVTISAADGENRTEAFLAKNPRGQIPVLEDGDVTVWDSQAILVYIARRHGGAAWLPEDPVSLAHVMEWLAVSENEILFGLARARATFKFKRSWNLEQCQELGRAGLMVMNDHLADREWLVGARPTIADIGCFPYTALAPEGGVGLEDYPAVQAWIARFKKLPGFKGMPGIDP